MAECVRSEMVAKVLLTVCVFVTCGGCEWVKLPQITNSPKVTYKIQTVASFADLPSSMFTNSDVLSSVFSYDRSNLSVSSSTTEMTLITKDFYQKPNERKHIATATVTSRPIDVKHEVLDHLDYQQVELTNSKKFHKETRKVIYMNQTVPMKVLPLTFDEGKKLTENEATDKFETEEEDDDGVSIVDDDEDFSSEEEYYEEVPPSTTSTRAPKRSPQKPQRRIQVMSMKSKPHNHLSFTGFIKFLKNIQESFATRTAKNISQKVKMLSKFRDNLLLSINQRIKSLWKTQSKSKTKKKKRRSKRTLGGGGGGGWMDQGGGMEFPSAEGTYVIYFDVLT